MIEAPSSPSIASTQLPSARICRPTVSVLIPTKNRAEELLITVRSLLAQSVLPSELLVADQSRDDRVRGLIEQELRDAGPGSENNFRFRYLFDPTISGAAEARNQLMNLAMGDIWLFLDDDVWLEPTCIEKILDVYRGSPEIDGVAGLITNYAKPPWTKRLWSGTFVRGPFRDERQPIYWKADELAGHQPIRVKKFTGACMSFRARAIRKLRFDPRLTGGSLAEDIDLCARVNSGSLVIAPEAKLVHRRSEINRHRDHWVREHAQSSYYMYRRNWRGEFKGRLSFLWLRLGYCAVVPAGCLRRRSLQPWRAFRQGVRRALALTS
jgi:GT2 family glycosyltransferase